MLGTLSGVLTTQFFGRRAARRAEEFAHRGQVRVGEPGIVEMAEQALAAVRRIREAADTGQVDELAAASVGKAVEFVARTAVEVG
ncbi:hypothetical protein [Amycolatopsis sp. NBC_00438]|uniref:hypothetical protein n=1 Tax=Amycolatopsis sp. NBC_00438 TaxID=2903558 RepID=UPI002E228580